MPPRPFTELERQPFFRRALWKRTAYLALAFVLNLVVLAFVAALHVQLVERDGRSWYILGYHVWLAYDAWYTYAWMAAILVAQVALAHYAFHKILDAQGMTSLFPRDNSDGRSYGGTTSRQLVQMVHELSDQMEVGPVRRIVVSDRPDPNAYTANILGLGNIVVLHANLLEIMPADSVRAIVAHEVGHMRRKDSLMYMMLGFPRVFITLMGAFILIKIGIGIFHYNNFWDMAQRVLFLALTWWLATFVLSKLGTLANLASQQSEHLADACAAWAVGLEPMLNGLLLVGERSEALAVLQQTLAKQPHLKEIGLEDDDMLRVLRRFPPRELHKEEAKRLASRLYIEARLAELETDLCVPFSDEDIVRLAKEADQALKHRRKGEAGLSAREQAELEKAEREKEAEQDRLLIDWHDYDRDRSGHLDVQETAKLVSDLRAQPEKMIFRQFLEKDAEWKSHPTMRDRVLFLYDAFRPDATRVG